MAVCDDLLREKNIVAWWLVCCEIKVCCQVPDKPNESKRNFFLYKMKKAMLSRLSAHRRHILTI
jgi:hypothetical protein